jgi:hypothetical protein
MEYEQPTLESLLTQTPIRDSIFAALGHPGVIVLRYVIRGVKRPNVQPLVAFAAESDLHMIIWELGQFKMTAKPPKECRQYVFFKYTTYIAFVAAASHGRLDVVKLFAEFGLPRDNYDVAEAAAEAGHFGIVRWMHRRGYISPLELYRTVDPEDEHRDNHAKCDCAHIETMITTGAAQSGNLRLLRWLYGKGYRVSETAERRAARRGHKHILEWIHVNVHKLSNMTQYDAAEAGQKHIIKYLIGLGLVDCSVYGSAAANGHIKLMRYLNKNGFEARPCAIEAAARHGKKRTILWLRRNGIEWGDKTCKEAAHYSVGMVKWVLDQGAPWHRDACATAVYAGKCEVVKFAKSMGLPYDRKECKRLKELRKKINAWKAQAHRE